MSGATSFLLFGIVLFGGGLWLVIALSRKAFYRRNQYGTELYNRFGSMVGERLLTFLGAVACLIGFFVIIGGLLALTI